MMRSVGSRSCPIVGSRTHHFHHRQQLKDWTQLVPTYESAAAAFVVAEVSVAVGVAGAAVVVGSGKNSGVVSAIVDYC